MAYCNNVDIEKWKKGILKRYLWKIWYYGSGLKNGWINKRSQPWPNYLLFCKSVARRESLWRVGKKERKKSNKLVWFYYMNIPFVRKMVSNPTTCLFVQRFFYERKCGFYRQHSPSSLQPFRRLVLPHALIVHPKEKLFWQETNYLTLYCISWAGSICRELSTLLPHGSVIVMWSITVSSFIFPWAHNGPDISIYRTGANGVRGCLATKPINTS